MKAWGGLLKGGQWYQHMLELGDHKYQHPGDACRTLVLPGSRGCPNPACMSLPCAMVVVFMLGFW